MRRIAPLTLMAAIWPACAWAHASEGGFILLLPTTFFVIGGALSVLLTVLLVVALPQARALRLLRPIAVAWPRPRLSPELVSCVSFLLLLGAVIAGVTGAHDPNSNVLPMLIWTLFWVTLFVLQGLFGDFWAYLNPWSGPYAALRQLGLRRLSRLPEQLGYSLAWLSFLGFAAVLLAHPAPKDPDELAMMVACYWALHFCGTLWFGPEWLQRAEGLSVALRCYAQVAIFQREGDRLKIGILGHRALKSPAPPLSLALFMVTLLAIGSFDGLNETFLWLGLIGVNPLEFPGRSGLIWQTLSGLAAAIAALVAVFWAAIWVGMRLVGQGARTREMLSAQAPALLPIALGYHFGHYLSAFLVEIQYVAHLACDWTRLCEVTVTTGFFNSLSSVRVIWLSQLGAVVLGHICAILLSHAISLRQLRAHRDATLSHLPLSALMVAYTVFGLWLLATPRGI